MNTVNLYTNGCYWSCKECGEENISLARRIELDLNDPELAELRDVLIDEEFDYLDADDLGDDELDEMFDGVTVTMYRMPSSVQCGSCGETYRTNVLSAEDSDKARKWKDTEEEADELLGDSDADE